MEDMQSWSDTRLEHYLRLDTWEPRMACGVLSLHLFPQETCTVAEGMARMNRTQKEINRLFQLWSSEGDHSGDRSPGCFIAWALSKNIQPDWLDWAVEQGLYRPLNQTN